MKTTCLSVLAVPALVLVSGLHAGQIELRYEWAPTLQGPFSPVPANLLKVHGDGSVTVATDAPQGFFRLVVEPGGAGGGAGVPVRTVDSLPGGVLELAEGFIASLVDGDPSESASESDLWKDAWIAPFYVPVTSAWNDTGEPDMAELKIMGTCARAGDGSVFPHPEAEDDEAERGFLLVGLSRKSPPMVGYAVDGPTPSETLLAKCEPGARVHCIRRFGPISLVAEDDAMQPVGNDGLIPILFTDQSYQDHAGPVSYTWDSEVENPRFPDAPPAAERIDPRDYRTYLAAYQGSEWLRKRHEQRDAFIEFDWQLLEGTAPTLAVTQGERRTFLAGEQFARFTLDDEEATRVVSVMLGGAAGGVVVEGMFPGAVRLTLFPATGSPRRFLITVASSAGGAGGGGQTGVFTTSQLWQAGSSASQPRFSQRSDLDRWCPAVGCGPVMLALMVTWAEHYQNVPSAYWNRDPNASLANRRASLRDIESPLEYVKGDNNVRMRQWYDHFHDACNVACWPHNGSGSALPNDVGSTLIGYASYMMGVLFPLVLANDPGGPLVGGSAHWEADVISDDWDESGVRTANAIKAGRPGGVFYMEHMHYCVAYRYRRTVTEIKVNGQTIAKYTQRLFRVNTGWGTKASKRDRVWNAYDIDGCYLLNIYQKRTLANP